MLKVELKETENRGVTQNVRQPLGGGGLWRGPSREGHRAGDSESGKRTIWYPNQLGLHPLFARSCPLAWLRIPSEGHFM